MQTVYNIVLGVSILVALVFAALVFFSGKGDAMSGGSGVRTSFKGKAGFDDFISRLILYLGVGFMVFMLVLDVIASRFLHK
ncbi:MAG: preprotein translocase subunit SecG [Fimbriimonadaceae bacterium]|nr:preprotein translocase subunit SecG [Fimbriimonadaceae bacterium]